MLLIVILGSISNSFNICNFLSFKLKSLYKITIKCTLRAHLVVIIETFLTFIIFEFFYYLSVKKTENVF